MVAMNSESVWCSVTSIPVATVNIYAMWSWGNRKRAYLCLTSQWFFGEELDQSVCNRFKASLERPTLSIDNAGAPAVLDGIARRCRKPCDKNAGGYCRLYRHAGWGSSAIRETGRNRSIRQKPQATELRKNGIVVNTIRDLAASNFPARLDMASQRICLLITSPGRLYPREKRTKAVIRNGPGG